MRLFATAIALAALAGILVQFAVTAGDTHSLGLALWVLLRYFTILTNILVAIVFGGIALGAAGPHPAVLGGAVVLIMLVGVVYALLLHGLVVLDGAALLADRLLHVATPVLAPLSWLAAAPKGGLRYRDALFWAAVPIAYVAYALVRGPFEGLYAYPFIDVGQIGAARVILNCLAIGLGFYGAGLAFVWLDHRLAGATAARP